MVLCKSKNQTDDIPQNMVNNGNVMSEGSAICDAFNEYFSNLFMSMDNKIKPKLKFQACIQAIPEVLKCSLFAMQARRRRADYPCLVYCPKFGFRKPHMRFKSRHSVLLLIHGNVSQTAHVIH